MEAGYGAEEQATRRSRRLAKLKREQAAAGRAQSTVEASIERLQREQRAWAAGAEGERLVARALETLTAYGWTTLHDVHWPGRPLANIDHIAIGPGGIVVVDAKNWTGDVVLRDGVLRQNGYRREREVDGVAQAAAAVTALLAPQHRARVSAMICLAAQDQPPAASGPGVTVVGRLQLAEHLVALPPRMTPYDVADVGRYLGQTLAEATTTSRGPGSRGGRGSRSDRRRTRPAYAHPTPAHPRPPRARRRSRGLSPGGALIRLGLLAVAIVVFQAWLRAMGS